MCLALSKTTTKLLTDNNLSDVVDFNYPPNYTFNYFRSN